jgi:hypothetical protein
VSRTETGILSAALNECGLSTVHSHAKLQSDRRTRSASSLCR